MKFIKYLSDIYTVKVNTFLNFFELKCNLPGLITEETIHVKEDLYHKNVTCIDAFTDNGHIIFQMWFDTEFGEYIVLVTICHHDADVAIEFTSTVLSDSDNTEGYIEKQLSEKQYDKVVASCLLLIETFLKTLIKIKRNYPCSNNCYYKNNKDKKVECDKMFISKEKYTPKK